MRRPRSVWLLAATTSLTHSHAHLAAILPADLAQRIGRQCGCGRRCGDLGGCLPMRETLALTGVRACR